VLVGGSFGALVGPALAERRPRGLRALVMSGGFAKADVSWIVRARLAAGRLLGQWGYPIAVWFHVRSLGSPFDPSGTQQELRDIFLKHCDAATFLHRGAMTLAADLRPGLSRMNVPTLILTPEHDVLIGPKSAGELRSGIARATEIVLRGTGHLLRFTHERDYAWTINQFLANSMRKDADRTPKAPA
jgi:pimeloyl-ACP methyl ester carboxylesterase